MADIYSNAFLTIAATAAEDSNGGCFMKPNEFHQARKLQESILHTYEEHGQDKAISSGYIGGNFGSWRLLDRAWVYQERRLSKRIIHFTEYQLLWECQSTFKSESGELNEDWTNASYQTNEEISKIPFKCPIEDTALAWQRTVEDYSKLDITFAEDRLPALAAIIKRMLQTRKEDTYIAGMWKSTLRSDLMWVYRDYESYPRTSTSIPTWSWACTEGSVGFAHPYAMFEAQLIDIHATNIGPPQLGNVVDANLTMTGRSFNAPLWRNEDGKVHSSIPGPIPGIPNEVLQHFENDSTDKSLTLNFNLDYNIQIGSQPVRTGHVFQLLLVNSLWECQNGASPVFWTSGLVLEKRLSEEYERSGTWSVFSIISSPVRRRARPRDNFQWRCHRYMMSVHPYKQFKIV
ncbi:unnamed protein product [Alternaria alternata]